MKKVLFLLLAIASVVALYAFSPAKKQAKKPSTTRVWWNFNGTSTVEMPYNWYYTLDENNFPDCPIMTGLVYCEVYAQQDPYSDPEDPRPDLNTITSYRMKAQ